MRWFCVMCILCLDLMQGAILHAESPATPDTTISAPATQASPGQQELPSWTLDRLIRETVAGNPQVLSKRAACLAAQEGVAAARWKLFPAPYVQVQQGNGDLLGTSNKRLEIYGIHQPIWTGGQLLNGLRVAKSVERSSVFSLQETRQSLALGVVNVYQNLLAWHHRMRAQENGVRLMERYAGIMERRVNAGVSAEIDRTQVNARLFQARSDLESSASSYRVAMAQMRQLVGAPLKDGEIAFFTEERMTPPPAADSLLADAEGASPVLERLGAEIETARYQEKLQKAALFPTLSLKAEHRNYLYANDATAHENVVYASLEYSFGAGLSTMANIRTASARVAGNVQARDAAIRDLRAKVAGDVEECSRSFRLYRQATLTSKASADVLASYTRMFVAGKRSWLDVLNAARELIQSEVSKGDIVAAYWAASYRLRLHAMDDSLIVADRATPPASTGSPATAREIAPSRQGADALP